MEVLFCVRAAGRPSPSMNAGAFRSELVIRRYGQHHRRPTGEKNDGNERGSGKRFDPAQWYLSRERSVETANTTLDVAIEHVRAYVPDFLREIDLSRIRTLLPDENTPVTIVRWQETITNVLEHLGKHLLNPVLSALPPTIERIIFLPYAELFVIPLHAAPLADGTSDRICDRYQVSYAPSLKVLSEARAKGLWETTPELYAVINPCSDPKLVFAGTEGSILAGLFAKRTIDLGPQGTKKHVVAGMQRQAYVHFACHGSYNWNDPTASGLELADDRLTLAQLQHGEVDLSTTRLVTLSACETGITDVVGGNAEEFVGIPAGFLLAGVPCVVSSLWAVFDLSTTLLMERFYLDHLISGMDFAAALREAQLWVRNLGIREVANHVEHWYRQAPQRDKSELFKWARHYRYLANTNPNLCPFEHPFYWAAFTVNGL